MDLELLNQFQDSLLETQIFECGSCKSLLVSPIMLVEDVGNVCYQCYKKLEEEKNITAIKNNALDTVLSKMEIPCVYQHNGCVERVKYKDIDSHKTYCEYRAIKCRLTSDCLWKGRCKDLLIHFNESHSEMILQSSDDTFNFVFMLNEQDIFRTLKTSSGSFILWLKVFRTKLKLLIFETNEVSPKLSYQFSIECSGKSNVKIQQECNVIKTISELEDFDENKATEVKLQDLTSVLPDDEFKVTILFTVKALTVNADILKLVECQVCRLIMKSPIYMCSSGHNICKICKCKVSSCPTCRVQYDQREIRNLTLENMMELFRIPCPNEEEGCKVRYFLLSDHELTCNFQKRKCVRDHCTFSGNINKLIEHVKKLCISPCPFQTSIVNKPLTSNFNTFVIYNDMIFKMSYSYESQTCSWHIQIITPERGSCQYLYELSLSLPTEDSLTIKANGVCSYYKKMVMSYSQQTVEKFCHDNTLHHKLLILKKVTL